MKKEKAVPQQMEQVPAQRYQADIANGLSQEQVQERIDGGWTNKTVTAELITVGKIVNGNLLTYFNLIFAILAILVIAAGSFRSLTFLPVVIANLFIGILQEIRAKKTLDQLTMLNAPKAEVVRNGQISEISAEELVLDSVSLSLSIRVLTGSMAAAPCPTSRSTNRCTHGLIEI